MLPLPLFRRPVMLTSNVAGAILGGAMMGTNTFVPLFVQGVLRGAPTDAGSAIAPMLIGWPVASAIGVALIALKLWHEIRARRQQQPANP